MASDYYIVTCHHLILAPTYDHPLTENRKIKVQHRMAVVQLQDLTSDEELCRVSQTSSCNSSERAHKVAKAYIIDDDSCFGIGALGKTYLKRYTCDM